MGGLSEVAGFEKLPAGSRPILEVQSDLVDAEDYAVTNFGALQAKPIKRLFWRRRQEVQSMSQLFEH
ncbi:MAG: hypothetical protein U1E03_05895 [Hyphomonadaceae bacterium]